MALIVRIGLLGPAAARSRLPPSLVAARRRLSALPPPPAAPPSAASLDAAAAELAAADPFSPLAHVLLDHPFVGSPWPYMTTVILATLALRLAATLPVTLWARARETRLREVLVPRLLRFRNEAQEGLKPGCLREGYPTKEYKKLVKARFEDEKKRLTAELNVSVWPTILTPAAVQIPLFVTLAYILRSASMHALSPLHGELLPWLGTPLALPDPTGVLPLTVGFLMWINSELLARGRETRERLAPWDTPDRQPREVLERERGPDGKPIDGGQLVEVETKRGYRERWFANMFRAGAVGFAGLSLFAPSCMQVYFITTYAFTLAQTLLLTSRDRTRLLALRAQLAADPPRAYRVQLADLPKEATEVPPLRWGVERLPSRKPPAGAITVEPVELSFNPVTGEEKPYRPPPVEVKRS